MPRLVFQAATESMFASAATLPYDAVLTVALQKHIVVNPAQPTRRTRPCFVSESLISLDQESKLG